MGLAIRDHEHIGTQDLPGAPEAHADLVTILDAIRTQRGLGVALEAAQALRQAVVAGRIHGEMIRPDKAGCCCAVGHIATVLGWDPREETWPHNVPGWSIQGVDQSALEYFVEDVRPGQTPHTSPILAALVVWLEAWSTMRRRSVPRPRPRRPAGWLP